MSNEEYSTEEPKDIRFKKPTFIDPLTGLYNQYFLYEFPPDELKKAKLGNYSLAVLMVDLDGFKEINDTYGHLSGDEILKQLAAILKKSVRQTDMVIRYAGDEFAILLLTADMKWSEVLSKKLIDNVDKNVFQGKEGQPIHLTMSIGFAIFPQDGEKMEELIDLADKALYLSKKKGKNRYSHAKEVSLEEISNVVAMDSFPCPEFIDRKDEIDRLKRIFETIVVKDKLLQAAFLCGESGTGKSRLLAELKKSFQDSAAIITSSASTIHTQDPYYLFGEGISSYIEKAGIENPHIKNSLRKLPSLELLQLSRIIPSLAGIFEKPAEVEVDEKKARFLLFKAFLDFLIELNSISPVVISFDDLQWADKGSMELLQYLCKHEKNKQIFIICSFTECNDLLGALLDDLNLNNNFTKIELKGFSLQDTINMISAIFPGLQASKEFYEQIFSVTKGNPSFIEEMLKSLVENMIIFYQDKGWHIKGDIASRDIPVSLDEVIKKRLKNLDEETKEMIVQAAVVGDNFSADMLKKIGNKDEGFILELLNRAKKMRLIDELDTKGKFHFVNKKVQNVLYNNDLDEKQRNSLHAKIGQALAEKHKDNLGNAAGEMAFHFSKAPGEAVPSDYNKLVLEKINQMFVPSEALQYLESLTKEITEENVPVAPLSEKMSKEAVKFAGLLQRAVKNFHLYPPGAMRVSAVGEVLACLNIIWQEAECLTLGEAQRCLIINGKRVIPRGIEQANVEYFLDLMIQTNLKSISFIKGIAHEGLDKFIQYLCKPAEYIIDNGGWPQVINKEKIEGIKIDEVRFVQLGASEKKDEGKKIEKAMIMEFLLGKIGLGGVDKDEFIYNMQKDPKKFAQSIMETSEKMAKESGSADESKLVINTIEKINHQILDQSATGGDHMKDLANVILELKPELRDKVIRSQYTDKEPAQEKKQDDFIEAIPDEIVANVILEEYLETQGNLLVLQDFVGKLLAGAEKRKSVFSKLESELLKRNVPKMDIDFIAGHVDWKELPVDRQVSNLVKLPDKYYKASLEKTKALLRDLDSKKNTQELDSLLFHLIAKTEQLPPDSRSELMGVITEYVTSEGEKETLKTEDKLDGLLKKLNIETNPGVFASILEIFKAMLTDFSAKMQTSKSIMVEIDKSQSRGSLLFINQFLDIVFNRYSWEREHDAQIYKIIDNFLRDILTGNFLEIIIYLVTSTYFQAKLDLKDVFPIAGEKLVEAMINIETKEMLVGIDSFREYVIKKEIVNLLKGLGEPALLILRKKLFEMKENMPVALIQLVGNLNMQGWVDLLVPSAYHSDPAIRRAAAAALSGIGGPEALELLSSMLRAEREKKLRISLKKYIDDLKKRG
jgi:diguanylate cyclase (GGDEF)-like protein